MLAGSRSSISLRRASTISISAGSMSNKKMTQQVLSVVGDTFADIVCSPLERLPCWGTDTLVPEPIRIMLGGSAANFAVHATTLGGSNVHYDDDNRQTDRPIAAAATDNRPPYRQSCVLHSSVAGDQLGEFVRKQLSEAKVELSQMRVGKDQGACVVLSGKDDRGFLSHRGSLSEFCRDDIDVPRLLKSSHVHIAGFYNCPALEKDLPQLLSEVRAGGATCSLGPQWDASEKWEGLEEVYPMLDVFLSNEDEILQISRQIDLSEAASFLLKKGVGLVVVTRGARGAVAISHRSPTSDGCVGGVQENFGASDFVHRKWEQRCTQVEVVDTTGAGDAFSAGFLCAWKATGGDVQVALKWGCAVGSAVVSRVGASGHLSVDDDIRPNLTI